MAALPDEHMADPLAQTVVDPLTGMTSMNGDDDFDDLLASDDAFSDDGSPPMEFAPLEAVSDDQGPTDYSEDFLNALDAPEGEAGEEPAEQENPADPLGVTQFDKSAASQLVDGQYYYDLIISGLDTADIKRELLKALDDKRFLWSLDELKGKLRGGQLVLKNLNPVKAVMLVIKLQHMDVDIRWEQKPYTDPSVGSGMTGEV